jgi:hypothetical protein
MQSRLQCGSGAAPQIAVLTKPGLYLLEGRAMPRRKATPFKGGVDGFKTCYRVVQMPVGGTPCRTFRGERFSRPSVRSELDPENETVG